MGRRRRPQFSAGAFDSIVGGVKELYREKVRPIEEQYMVSEFFYPLLTDADFDAKPLVLLVGSYSTGKTSFIRYLLDQDFPGMHIGPEPTTDGFQAILYGTEECVATRLPGLSARLTDSCRPFECSSQEAAARQHSRLAAGLSVWRARSIWAEFPRALLRL